MAKLRPDQVRSPAKKITPELLRKNPFLAKLFGQRAREVREILEEKKKWELPLD